MNKHKLIIWLPLVSFGILSLGGFITWRITMATAQISAEHSLRTHTNDIKENKERIGVVEKKTDAIDKEQAIHTEKLKGIEKQLDRIEESTKETSKDIKDILKKL